MSKIRFFIGGVRTEGDTIEITGADAHKIKNVLRMHPGDTVTICDSAATEFQATLEMNDSRVFAQIGKDLANETLMPALRITVAQCVPKGQKMDFVIEKLTELGVATITPLHSERTIAGASEAKCERWRRLAKTAAQQCGRRDIPTITNLLTFDDFLKTSVNYDRVLLPWELAERIPLSETLPPLLEGVKNVAVIIGPEGGFSHAEVDTASEKGAVAITLGSRILRTETAALTLVAILNYLKDS